MAEIEHFVDPLDKSHPKFKDVAHVEMPLWSAQEQEDGVREAKCMSIGDALTQGVVKNETIAYFMARSFMFLMECGIKKEAIRFRQHRAKEMAHYANDCWDAEVETSYGWIEVAGHSDRSAFDLTRHQNKTKTELMAGRPLKEPIIVKSTVATLDKKVCGPEFKKDAKLVTEYFENLTQDDKKQLAAKFAEASELNLEIEGKTFKLGAKHVSFGEDTKKVTQEKYIPHVIEPSFGLGRIIYCIFEHNFKVRAEDA